MEGVIEIKYDKRINIIEKEYRIDEKKVSKEEFFEKINELDSIEIIHTILPLYPYSNEYGYIVSLENLKSDILLFNLARYSISWNIWLDIGISGKKYDYENIKLKNSNNLADLIYNYLDLEYVDESVNIQNFIERHSDVFLYEEDIKEEIIQENSYDEDYEVDIDEIKNYIKNIYPSSSVVNIMTDEGEIYSI